MRVLALRHDPLKPHLAGVRKHERAILVVEVLVEAQPRCRTPEQARERRLAHCERVAPQIVAIENALELRGLGNKFAELIRSVAAHRRGPRIA